MWCSLTFKFYYFLFPKFWLWPSLLVVQENEFSNKTILLMWVDFSCCVFILYCLYQYKATNWKNWKMKIWWFHCRYQKIWLLLGLCSTYNWSPFAFLKEIFLFEIFLDWKNCKNSGGSISPSLESPNVDVLCSQNATTESRKLIQLEPMNESTDLVRLLPVVPSLSFLWTFAIADLIALNFPTNDNCSKIVFHDPCAFEEYLSIML